MAKAKKHPSFREPPDKVTYACLVFMARVAELRSFVSFFFGLMRMGQEKIGKLTTESQKAFQEEANKYELNPDGFSAYMQMIRELMVSRAVESYELYFIIILHQLFEKKPELLKSDSTIDVATIIELKNFEDILQHIADRKLHELSYKPLAEFRKFIVSRTGIDLFKNEKQFESVRLLTEIRNLIAHNDCRINDIFLRRIKKKKEELPISSQGKFILDEEWTKDACYALDEIVFDFDEAIAKKFDLHQMNRTSAFLYRH